MPANDFKDNFSKHAARYAQHRPVYPRELFAYLGSLTEQHELAWDCGCGNGQCAVPFSQFYEQVYATDPSTQQIENAVPKPNIVYKVEKAEQPTLNDHSVDLITIAQALHWFDVDMFYPEVKRVLKPGGVIAVISYMNPRVSLEIDTLTNELHDGLLHDYWLPENRLVEMGYSTIPFPFEEIHNPEFRIEKLLSKADFLGHIRSWSAIQRFIDQNGIDPMAQFTLDLNEFWLEKETKEVTWHLTLKTGRNIKTS